MIKIIFKKYVFLMFLPALLFIAVWLAAGFSFDYRALLVLLAGFLCVRCADDISDYKKDSVLGKAAFGIKTLIVLTAFFIAVLIVFSAFLSALSVIFTCAFLAVLCAGNIKALKISAVKILLLPALTFAAFYNYKGIAVYVFAFVVFLLAVIFYVLRTLKNKHRKGQICTGNAGINNVGGKAFNLLRVSGVNCPRFFVLTVDYFDSLFCGLMQKIDALVEDCDSDGEYFKKIKQLVLTDEYKNKIALFLKKRLKANKFYAVRSSAVGEDDENHSFAGMMESYLDVKPSSVAESVIMCFLSAFDIRAIAYRKINNIRLKIRTAVVVQDMVCADYAGVINTINPITSDAGEMVISIIKGAGENLVLGKENSVDYYVKGKKIASGADGFIGLKVVKKISALGVIISRQSNRFQDIEFAVRKNKVYFLQTRAIAAYSGIDTKAPVKILDNSNIVESFSGACSPLTVSYAKEVYYNVYLKTFQVAGIPKKIINKLMPCFEKMVEEFEGNIYYNLGSWYKVNGIFPAAKNAVSYMEKMMGIDSPISAQRVKLNIFSLVPLLIKFLSKLKNISTHAERFLRDFDNLIKPYSSDDFSAYSDTDCVKIYEGIALKTMEGFTVPIYNDVGVMMNYGRLLKKLTKLLKSDGKNGDAESFAAYLLKRNKALDSAQSAELIYKLTEEIEKDSAVKEDFLSLDADTLYQKYKVSVSYLSPLLDCYYKNFAARTAGELKLETLTMVQRPSMLFNMLKDCVSGSLKKIEGGSDSQYKDIILPHKIKKLVEKTEHFVFYRERLRLTRTHTFSAARNIFLKLGKSFCNKGIIDDERDIFYLTKKEAFSIAQGDAAGEIKQAVLLRKKEYEKNNIKEACRRVYFFGESAIKVKTAFRTDGVLTGVPGGGGKVCGEIKFALSPYDEGLNGKIVLASQTDPSWITAFPLIKGLIVERGSILSHSAVIAREMGIPSVFGATGASKILKDGDTVTLDSAKGEIRVEKI